MFYKFLLSTFFCFLFYYPVSGQTKDVLLLEKKVQKLNDTYQYLLSLKEIDNFLENTSTPYDTYYAYLLKSYTYKRLFNYEDALRCLDSAYKNGVVSERKKEVEAAIKSEKAFVYFDIHEYDKAEQLMKELRADNYTYISGETRSFLVMQEGYIFYLNKEHQKAEEFLDIAITLMNEFHPRNLPMVYGKKVELYNQTGQFEKREQAFHSGLAIAQKYNLLKYEMYMYEMLNKSLAENQQYQEVYNNRIVLDSLTRQYDAESHNAQLKIYEKNIELKEKEYQLKKFKTVRNFLALIIAILSILAVISYKLFRSKQKEHQLLEKEYERIYEELTLLAQEKSTKGKQFELNAYPLTPRQLEIIEHLKTGKTNKQIAADLHISENTVKYHIKSIYEILQVESRMQLFRLLKGNAE